MLCLTDCFFLKFSGTILVCSLVSFSAVLGWTTVSEEHSIYVVDVGLTPAQCDSVVTTTEQACKGRYAAYTYAKQTLGCREYPVLARAALGPVHSMVGAILEKFGPKAVSRSDSGASGNTNGSGNASGETQENGPLPPATTRIRQRYTKKVNLQLDDREPHIVKYDVTKKERQKLDMHTDKSEWTFLIALSNGCGQDYEGGGTYFECLDATVHIQKGHALVFPGKLRHRGQAIHHGLRFLLVGFLVDKGTYTRETPDAVSAPTPAPTTTAAIPQKEPTSCGTLSDSVFLPTVVQVATA
jgi:hypothetical protein